MYNPRQNFYVYCNDNGYHGEEGVALRILWQALADVDIKWLEGDEAEFLCGHLGLHRDEIDRILPYYLEGR